MEAQLALPFVAVLLLSACGRGADDTSSTGGSTDACADDQRTPSLTLGTGAGSVFEALSDGDPVSLAIAPQGGFGVSVRAQSTGLLTGPVDVLLDTEIDGSNVGNYLNQGVNLYCQDSGEGLLWGLVVGFDSAVYQTNDDLLSLDGQSVDLVVSVTDAAGASAQTQVSVLVAVGAR